LPKSHSHYKDFLDLRGDGRIVLYKRADHENPKWTVRLKIPEVPGFVVKSTKTTDDFEARRFAEDLYYRLEGKARRGEPINSPTFRRVFTEWAKVPVADQVVRSARYVNGNVRRVEIWALQYFGDLTIDKVTENLQASNAPRRSGALRSIATSSSGSPPGRAPAGRPIDPSPGLMALTGRSPCPSCHGQFTGSG
jgi:hypothetical protein